MSNYSTFDISASGIYAQRVRMDTIADNVANAETTRTASGGPYRRKIVTFRSAIDQQMADNPKPCGVKVDGVVEDAGDFRVVHDPGHPDADANGYVKMPNVNVVEEMVDMISATRAYEANITALNAAKSMINAAIDIGRG